MERDDRPPHVEVGLTASGDEPPHRGRFRRKTPIEHHSVASPVAAGDAADGVGDVVETVGEAGPGVDQARRAIAIGASGLVIGLTVGWLVGGGIGSDPDAATSSTPASSSPADDADGTADDADASLDTLPAPEPAPTTTRPRPTTTTTLPEVGTVALNPLVAGTDMEIVGVQSSSKLVDIDAASGEMVTTGVSGGAIDSNLVIAGSDWVVTMNLSSGRASVLGRDGEFVDDTDLGDAWSLLPIPGTDLFWRADPNSRGPTTRFEQVDLGGEPTGLAVTNGAGWPSGVDPAGGIVYIVQGKSYSVDEDGARLIADGEVLGLTTDTAVLRVCDAQLDCDLAVVDRASGATRTVDVPEGLTDATGYYLAGQSLAGLSPDGRALIVGAYDDAGITLSVVDLDTAEVQQIPTAPWGIPNATWTSDGAAVLYVDGSGVPTVYDRATGETAPLADGLTGWQRIVVRP